MNIKTRGIPLQLLGLEALVRRVVNSNEMVEADLKKWKSGYSGERSLDYYLNQLDDFLILHDLRLSTNSYTYFQLDTLLLSRCGLVILEVKNYQGRITFNDENHQVLRTLHQVEERIPNPLLQASRQKIELEQFLIMQGWPTLPISYFVVYSSPQTILNTSSQKVIHAEALPSKLRQYVQSTRKECLTTNQMNQIGNVLKQSHQPPQLNLLQKYNVAPPSIRTGVHCPKCSKLVMTREPRYRKWTCAHCAYQSSSAHIATLQDYALLFGPTITNEQARFFLNIKSPSATKYHLNQLNLHTTGKNRGHVYHIPLPFTLSNKN
ncbi:nuclease-related domain-containing protein [Alkalihalobacillus sp. FSL R5-0424]